MQNYGPFEDIICEDPIDDGENQDDNQIDDDGIENQLEEEGSHLSQRAQRQCAEVIRTEFMEYFTRVDELPWQYTN